MALVETYNGLVTALKEAMEDDSVEFSDYIPTAIDLAETRLIEEVYLEGTAMDIDTPVNQGTNLLTKPVGYRATRSLSLITATTSVRLLRRARTFIYEYAPDTSIEGTPKYYADFDGTSFIVTPTPDSLVTYRLHYIGRPPALSVANQTNFFITDCADALFYACMSELGGFSKDPESMGVYEAKYQNAIQNLAGQAKREKGDDDQQFVVGVDTSVNQ